jgi:hypothetical protein
LKISTILFEVPDKRLHASCVALILEGNVRKTPSGEPLFDSGSRNLHTFDYGVNQAAAVLVAPV